MSGVRPAHRCGVERAEVPVDRVHLEDEDTTPREQLVEDVES